MGNEISVNLEEGSGYSASPASTLASGSDPPESEMECCSKAKDSDSVIDQHGFDDKHKSSASVATEKVRNGRASKNRGVKSVIAGDEFLARQYSPEPVKRSVSYVYSGQSEWTPQAQAAIIQTLKEKAYKSILLHASATGRNAVLNLSYTSSIEPCGADGGGRRVLVTARGTPTVVVQEIPMASQNARRHPLPPLAIHAY